MTVIITFYNGDTKIYDDVEHIKFLDNRSRCLALVRKRVYQTVINWDHVKTMDYDRKQVDAAELNMD